jgi:hypothetical protein
VPVLTGPARFKLAAEKRWFISSMNHKYDRHKKVGVQTSLSRGDRGQIKGFFSNKSERVEERRPSNGQSDENAISKFHFTDGAGNFESEEKGNNLPNWGAAGQEAGHK